MIWITRYNIIWIWYKYDMNMNMNMNVNVNVNMNIMMVRIFLSSGYGWHPSHRCWGFWGWFTSGFDQTTQLQPTLKRSGWFSRVALPLRHPIVGQEPCTLVNTNITGMIHWCSLSSSQSMIFVFLYTIHIWSYTHTYIYTYVYVYIYIYTYVCVSWFPKSGWLVRPCGNI